MLCSVLDLGISLRPGERLVGMSPCTAIDYRSLLVVLYRWNTSGAPRYRVYPFKSSDGQAGRAHAIPSAWLAVHACNTTVPGVQSPCTANQAGSGDGQVTDSCRLIAVPAPACYHHYRCQRLLWTIGRSSLRVINKKTLKFFLKIFQSNFHVFSRVFFD